MRRWEFTGETKTVFGIVLHRIKASVTFTLKCGIKIEAGELGGWIEKESNLDGDAWVYGDAWVFGDARVYGDAWVYGNAQVKKTADYIVLKNNWSSGRYFTYTLSNKMWKVGCFYGTGEALIKKAYADSELSGKCYEAAVRYVEALEKIQAEE